MRTREYMRREWLQLIILTLPFVLIFVCWQHVPEEIATHWNMHGEVDGYAHKTIGLFILPITNILIALLFAVLPRLDPRGRNYDLFKGPLRTIRLTVTTFMLMMFLVILGTSLGFDVNATDIVMYGVLLLFLVLGNLMGNIRSNYFVGVRTPWTLENTEVWRKTHRLTGTLWVVCTLVMIVLKLVLAFDIFLVVFAVYFVAIVIVPILYSFFLYKSLSSVPGDTASPHAIKPSDAGNNSPGT